MLSANTDSTPASIYKVTHLDSGRVYIGKTCRKGKPAVCRWQDHVSGALSGRFKTYFHNAIRLYGQGAFSFEVIELCRAEDANERERFWIAQLNSNVKGFGFNLTVGGDGGLMNDEIRKKISETKKGVSKGPHSQETIERIRQSKIGKRRSAETIAKMSEARKGATLTQEWKDKISAGLKASAVYKLTDEQVLEIQQSTLSDSELAKVYNVSRKTIWRARRNRLGVIPLCRALPSTSS